MSQYESSVKCIPYPQERVYAKLEDLNNVEGIKELIPEDKINNLTFSRDELSATISPVGNITLRVIDREIPKCIKFEVGNSPIPLNIWIQIIPDGVNASKMRIVVKAEINFMLRSMIEKPLKEGLEKIAEGLSQIAY